MQTRLMQRRGLMLYLCSAGFFLGAFQLDAQSGRYVHLYGPELSVELLKPSFSKEIDRILDPSVESVVLFLNGRFPVGTNSAVVGELALSHFGGRFETLNETILGNPYVGWEMRLSRTTFFEIGWRLPVVGRDDVGGLTGSAADLVERTGAFSSETFSIRSTMRHSVPLGPNTGLHLRGGPVGLIHTKDTYEDRAEGLFHYGGHLGHRETNTYLEIGMAGLLWFTEADLDLGDLFTNQLFLRLGQRFGSVYPGLYASLPLDDNWQDVTDFVVGLTFSFSGLAAIED